MLVANAPDEVLPGMGGYGMMSAPCPSFSMNRLSDHVYTLHHRKKADLGNNLSKHLW